MLSVDLLSNRVVVFAAALIYWVGVFVQARRVRHMIGKQPNVKPRGTKEKLLWMGWFLVVFTWLTLPFLAKRGSSAALLKIYPALVNDFCFWLGVFLSAAGYIGTLWCYVAMGSMWRMGVNRAEKTVLVEQGPFYFVRHPIYVLQLVMLAGTAFLLPTLLSFSALALHVICVMLKAADEEAYLRSIHGAEWVEYLARTGRFFPKLRFRPKS
jgi:protein-S-isoprenylcysteine O-methyltransferase Ste14